MFVGGDAHIDPAERTVFTEISGEFATFQGGRTGSSALTNIRFYTFKNACNPNRTACVLFVIYAFMSSFAVCFIVSMTLSASSRVLPTAER